MPERRQKTPVLKHSESPFADSEYSTKMTLKDWRISKKLTQKQLAEVLETTQKEISNNEVVSFRSIGFTNIFRIAMEKHFPGVIENLEVVRKSKDN